MTRYKLDIPIGDYGLDCRSKNLLLAFLQKKITQHVKNRIIKKINLMNTDMHDYGLLSVSQNILIGILKSDISETTLNLGYPFPVVTRKIGTQFPGYIVNIYLRGESIRKRQRDHIFRYIPGAVIHKTTLDTFQTNLKQIYSNYSTFLSYVDLYKFIGDGILGLYFVDTLRPTLNIPTNRTFIFSRNSRHMPPKENVRSISELYDFIKGHNDFTIIIPNLLDNQFNEFIDIINSLKDKNALILIPSRNMYIEITHTKTHIWWYKNPDILLTNQPIVEYMHQSLSPFIFKHPVIRHQAQKTSTNRNVFINPFSSLSAKEIPVDECADLCKNLKAHGFNVFVSNGLNRDKYTNTLKQHGVKIIKDNGLNELANLLIKNNIDIVISTDSSVAHLSAYMNLMTIVIYKNYFWDSNTIQSMTNDSPAGFCRADLPMIPVIDTVPNDIINILLNRNIRKFKTLEKYLPQMLYANDETILKIHTILMTIIKPTDAYQPNTLLKNILKKSNRHDTWQLAHNIWINLPEYKISKLNAVGILHN